MSIKLAKLDYIDIRPGTMRQVHRALASGRLVEVTHGPNEVGAKLREIDESLHLHYDPYELIWVVMQERSLPDGSTKEELVTTAQEEDCDDRLVARVRQIASSSYDYVAEIERVEAEADKEHAARQSERFGDASERLAFAVSRDLGRHETSHTPKSRAFIPRAFNPRP